MQVVRLVKTSDLQQVSELIKKTGIGMTTMPKNRKEVQERIAWSVNSANKKSANPNKDTYLFVLENEKKIIGISAIYTSVSKEKPSVFFKLKKIKLSSDTYKFEKTSDILQLHLLHKPYSELGTIFIDPSSRGRGRGSLLSFARLQLIAAHKSRFDKKILVEIRGWKDKNNKSYFWESFSKAFFNLDFFSIDRLSYIDNHFITESVPKFPFIVELLPKRVQKVLAKPHPNAMPALSMLAKQGFKTNGLVDILDGGPCMEVLAKKIPIVKSSFKVKVEVKRSLNFSNYGFITNYSLNNFRVVRENYNLIKNNTIKISQKTAKALQISTGDKVRINIESI
jgi:arginine N-succinyltransferase